MTFEASHGCASLLFELVVWIAFMHGVAGQTGDLAFQITGGSTEGRELSASGKDRPIWPPALAKEIGIVLQVLPPSPGGAWTRMLDIMARTVKIIPGLIERRSTHRVSGELFAHDVLAMTLTTNLR